jgi:hypothetical protein
MFELPKQNKRYEAFVSIICILSIEDCFVFGISCLGFENVKSEEEDIAPRLGRGPRPSDKKRKVVGSS